jgi:hypothetical protein
MTLSILRRVLLETCFTLEYLIKAGDHEAYSAFMQGDAMRQRNLLEFTEKSQPELEPIRSKIIEEIKQGFKRDGIKRKNIPKKPRYPKSWHPDMRIEEIAHALGKLGEQWFATSYANDSETIHPSWQDIINHHLHQDPNTNYLIPNPNTPVTTVTQVEGIVCWIFHTAYDYISMYAPNEHKRLNAIKHIHHKLHEPITRIHQELQSTSQLPCIQILLKISVRRHPHGSLNSCHNT